MSARKLGRRLRLVFVLAVLVAGGVGAGELSVNHAGAPATIHSATPAQPQEIVWD